MWFDEWRKWVRPAAAQGCACCVCQPPFPLSCHLHGAELAQLHDEVRLPAHIRQQPTAAACRCCCWRVRCSNQAGRQRAPARGAAAPLLQPQREAREQLHDVGVAQVGVQPRLVLVLSQLQRNLCCMRVLRWLSCSVACGRLRWRRCLSRCLPPLLVVLGGWRRGWWQRLPDLDDLDSHEGAAPDAWWQDSTSKEIGQQAATSPALGQHACAFAHVRVYVCVCNQTTAPRRTFEHVAE